MMEIWKKVYETYAGDSERHRMRLTIMLFTSLFIGVFGSDLPKNVFEVMSLAISVLAGFSFTALFSSHSITTFDLPEPKNETDRAEIGILKVLGENFRTRARFFIIISVIDLILILALSLSFSFFGDLSNAIGNYIDLDSKQNIICISGQVGNFVRIFLNAVVIFIFFECLYTFYRLSETILAVLDNRSRYIDAHTENKKF